MAASRAALLGLAALLALQHSSSGSDSPELSSHNHSAPLDAHHNRQHGLSHRSRSVPHEPYRSHKNVLQEISSPELHASDDETIKKKSRRREGGMSANIDAEVEVEGASYVGGGQSSTVLNMPPRPGTYIPSNCSSCHIREELKNISLQTIKEQVLHKLGMKHAPNMTGRSIPKIPPLHHLLEAYGMQSDQPDRFFQPGMTIHEEEDDYHAKTTMVIVVAQTTKLRHGGGIGTDLDIQHFRFSEHSIRNKVAGGSMFVYVPATNRPIKVRVYRVMGNATEHQSMTILNTASSKLSEHRKPGWVELETPKLLMEWFKNPQDNLGVVIKLEDDSGHLMPYVVDTHDHNGESKQPFVRVYTTDGRKHRNKRTIGLNCHENSQESRCCRYPLTVDFEEFGWDWIIAPKKYDANYCSGECPYVFLQKYPHTHIVQQANPTGTAGPCCAPRKMSPISMLYFDNEFNIIYGLLPGMVVDRCGCQ